MLTGKHFRWWERFIRLRGRKTPRNPSAETSVYPETLFRGLIQQELKRAAYSGFCCRLLLVYRDDGQRGRVQMESRIASRAISVLSKNVRGTDYLGWYRDQHILGVLLTLGREGSSQGEAESVELRLSDAMRVELARENLPDCHVRIISNGAIENPAELL